MKSLPLPLLLLLCSCVAPGSLEDRGKFESALKKQAAATAQDDDDGGVSPNPSAGKDAGTAASACPDVCMLLEQRCATAGCHAASAPAGQLDLKSSGIAMRLSGMMAHTSSCSGRKLIDTTDPDKSVLYGKLLDPPACGPRMPIGAPLTADQIECVRKFVAEPSCGGGK